jgi:ribose transport system substrate-binding protein
MCARRHSVNRFWGNNDSVAGATPVRLSPVRRAKGSAILSALTSIVLLAGALCLSSPASGSTSTGKSRAAAALEVAPKTIDIKKSLPSKPKTEHVALVILNSPVGSIFTKGFDQAISALGWVGSVYQYTDPTDAAAAVQQALESKPNFLMSSGLTPTGMQQQLNEAESEKIPFIDCYNADLTVPSNDPYFYNDCFDNPGLKQQGSVLAKWVVDSAKSTVNMGIVSIPAIPLVALTQDALSSTLTSDCAKCTSHVIAIPPTDVGNTSAVIGTITSYVQSHPGINTLAFTYDYLSIGVPQALASAGLAKNIRIVGSDAQADETSQMLSGKESGWTALNPYYIMWVGMDIAARLSEGAHPAPESQTGVAPTFIITPATAAHDKNGWTGPVGYEAAFKKLWKVS